MDVGLAIPQVGALADPATVRAVAVAADRAGYHSLWAMDRVLAPLAPRTPYPAAPDGALPPEQRTVLDPIGVLTLAAAVTERIRLGTSVLVGPWYPPVLLARALATLDQISGGRLDVGLGMGWSQDEFEAVGVPQRDLASRTEELLDVLDVAWTSEVVELVGDRIAIAPSTIGLKPVQRPRPPVLLAAYTPAGLERIARRADGWIPAGLPVEAIAPMWAALRDLAAGHGRDPDDLSLVVRANIKLTDVPLAADRPSYWGSCEQVADDLAATRDTGADVVVLDLHSNAGSGTELLDLADDLSAATLLAATTA